jgi:hypothetical protein
MRAGVLDLNMDTVATFFHVCPSKTNPLVEKGLKNALQLQTFFRHDVHIVQNDDTLSSLSGLEGGAFMKIV